MTLLSDDMRKKSRPSLFRHFLVVQETFYENYEGLKWWSPKVPNSPKPILQENRGMILFQQFVITYEMLWRLTRGSLVFLGCENWRRILDLLYFLLRRYLSTSENGLIQRDHLSLNNLNFLLTVLFVHSLFK